MNRYTTFLLLFIISMIALAFFIYFYFNAIFTLIGHAHAEVQPDPFEIFSDIFTPPILISGVILGLSSLAYRIVGIVSVARNKSAADGEKALWIIGFIIMGFVTAIVFLIMARGRGHVE